MQNEEWRPVNILAYRHCYEVSNRGRVRRTRSGRVLSPDWGKKGYGQVKLSVLGVQRRVKVYHLVAEAFGAIRPNADAEINHIDGNPRNNAVTNLEWTTGKGNCLHSTRVLGRNRGENASRARLTDADVRRIRSLIGKQTNTSIASEYGITKTHVGYIRDRKVWSHLS